MSTLTLVRHGQARPFQQVDDGLSPLGAEQSRKLGEFWTRHRIVFDAVYCGSLTRQRQTADRVGECYKEAGLPWPSPQVAEELNEYDAQEILGSLLPYLAGQDPNVANLVDAHERSGAGTERYKHFQRVFEAVMIHWVHGTVRAAGVESWLEFRGRVQRGIRRIREESGSGKRIAAFTSGGPIGTTVQFSMAAPDRMALEVNWRVRNGSMTEFVFTLDRFNLDMFNAVPHLDDPSLWTYR